MMRALVWKDLRVNLFVLVFGAIMLLAPYAAGVIREVYLRAHDEGSWLWHVDGWGTLAIASLSLSLLTLALLGGVAFAAERQDRSAEFLAYLPPSRATLLTSKLIVALGACAVIWGLNLLVAYTLAPAFCDTYCPPDAPPQARPIYHVPEIALIAVLMFGVAWYCSAFLESPTIAAGAGIFAPAFLAGGLNAALYFLDAPPGTFARWYPPLCGVLGLVAFLAGCLIYLRRVEP